MASTSEDLFAAIESGDVSRVAATLEADPALATARDVEGVSALMRARYRFDDALVAPIRAHVAELDLFEAASFGDAERLAELLTIEPSSVDMSSGDGFTALHFAAFFGLADAVRLLVARGAEVDARATGWMTGTALHSAASARHADVVETLLEAGADPNTRQAGGWTPLHGAARNGDLASVALLLDAGATASATNDDGSSVLDIARSSGDEATQAAIVTALDQ